MMNGFLNRQRWLKAAPYLLLFFGIPAGAYAQDRNVIEGEGAGTEITSGDDTVMFGSNSGGSNQFNAVYIGAETGSESTGGRLLIGFEAGRLGNSSLLSSTAIGAYSARQVESSRGVFLGYRTGFTSNSSSASNLSFIGHEAGFSNTTGRNNTFIGADAGYQNTTGPENLYAGFQAGYNASTGYRNIAVGYQALRDVGASFANAAFGAYAGAENETGVANVFGGAYAGFNNLAADANTFVGLLSGWSNDSSGNEMANGNTLVGAAADWSNVDGEENVIIGAFAGSARWQATQLEESNWATLGSTTNLPTSIPSGETGLSRRAVLGSQAFAGGNDVLLIGAMTEAALGADRSIVIGSQSAAANEDAFVIGFDSDAHDAFSMVFGNDSTTHISPDADGVINLGSTQYRYANVLSQNLALVADANASAPLNLWANTGAANTDRWRMEAQTGGTFAVQQFSTGAAVDALTLDSTGNLTVTKDINLLSDARLKQNITSIPHACDLLDQVTGTTYTWKEAPGRDTRTHIGFIAQDVEKVLPELVRRSGEDVASVNYQGFIPILVEATKELQTQSSDITSQSDAQAEALQQLRKELDQERARLAESRKRLEALRATLP